MLKRIEIEPKEYYQDTKIDAVCGEYYANRRKYPHTGLVVDGNDVGYERYRDKYPDFPFIDKVDDVEVSLEYHASGRAEVYVPQQVNGDELVVFIHGGGWWAGNIDRYRYVCKYIAHVFERKVYSLDYDLAPEFVFPHQVEQIASVVRELSQDRKLILFGDSAGGNLALAETLKLKDESGKVKAQILFYPCVDLTNDHDRDLWSIERYAEKSEAEKSLIQRLRPKDGIMAPYYFKDEEDRHDDLASPFYMKDHSFYPKTIIVSAGLDYLRLQGLDFAQKLADEGVDTTLITYKGVAHGFFDRLYYFWQAEDSIQRVCALCQESSL